MISDPWLLVETGRFQEAYESYTKRYEADGRLPNLANRGIVLLNMGRFADAERDFQTIVSLKEDSSLRGDGSSKKLGAAQWLQGKYDAAIASWKDGLDAPYSDGAGGVEIRSLLLFAAVKLQDSDLEQLSMELLGELRETDQWPGPIGSFHLGRMGPRELVRSSRASSRLRVRQQCQADFHLAVNALRQKQPDLARYHFTAAAMARPEARIQTEHYLAKGEAASMQGSLSGLEAWKVWLHNRL